MLTALVGGIVAAIGIFIFIDSLGRRRSGAGDPLAARLSVYDEVLDAHEIALQRSFGDRVLAPFGRRLISVVTDRTPEKARASIQAKIQLAGRPNNITVERLVAIRYGLAIALFVVGLAIGLLFHNTMLLLASLGGALAGFYGPLLWLRQKVGDRQKQIGLTLPDAMDLLTIAVEAGLGFDAALVRLSDKMKNALGEEFATVLSEVRLGRPRMEALDDLGRRCGVADLHNFVQAVIQSEQMGVGLAKILRLQSDEMRRKRRQKAQEKAAQATLKMMLPMVGCIFPTLWIILLGPAILIIMAKH